MKVLLVIDLQRDFCPGGALAVSEGDKIVPLVNRLMREGDYDLRIATLDWHPEDHGSFATNHPGRSCFELGELEGVPQVLWPVHCVQGSSGAEFHSDIEAQRFDHIVRKGLGPLIDSYSGFFDNQKRGATELYEVLKAEATRRGESPEEIEIHVVGLALDYCVGFTALDAAELKLKVSVVVDGTRAVNVKAGDDEAMLRRLVGAGVQLIPSRDVLPEIAQTESVRVKAHERRPEIQL